MDVVGVEKLKRLEGGKLFGSEDLVIECEL